MRYSSTQIQQAIILTKTLINQEGRIPVHMLKQHVKTYPDILLNKTFLRSHILTYLHQQGVIIKTLDPKVVSHIRHKGTWFWSLNPVEKRRYFNVDGKTTDNYTKEPELVL